jgi:hypothetical protein
MIKLFQDVAKIIQPILKFASVIGLRNIKKMLEMIHHLASEQAENLNSDSEHIRKVSHKISRLSEEAWLLRNAILQDFTEKKYLLEQENWERFQNILKAES